MFLDGEISFFNSEAKIASDAAADKSLPSPLPVSRLISSEQSAPSAPDYPRVVIRGSLLRYRNSPLKTRKKRATKNDKKALDALLKSLFFDWFQFTASSSAGTAKISKRGEDQTSLHDMFIFARKNGLNPLSPCNGNNGYGAALPFSAGLGMKDAVVRISGCSKTGIMPNFQISGGKGLCAKLAVICQQNKTFYNASLSRADVAYDISQEGLFEDLYEMSCVMCEGNKKIKKPDIVGKLETGLTFYIGSKKSAVTIKVYQKDLERANKGEINFCDADRNLVRIEITFRPHSTLKKAFFLLTPQQMVETSPVARKFLSNAAVIINVTSTQTKVPIRKVERMVKQKTLESTVQHGFKQYSKAITNLAIKNIVDREFGGSVAAAKVHPIKIMQEVKEMLFAEYQRSIDAKIINDLIIKQRVDKPRSDVEDDMELMRRLYNFSANDQQNKKESAKFITHAQAQMRFNHKTMFTPEEIAIAKSIKRHNKKMLQAA